MSAPTSSDATPDPAILDFVLRAGLAGTAETPRFTALTGGVSSDIWLMETSNSAFCVKRALSRLRVAADWRAPVERSVYEAAWLKGAGVVVPEAVPRLLADDPERGMLAMEYLTPADHKLWKAELLAGRPDAALAHAVGDSLGRIHAAFARDPAAPGTFPRDDIFHSIRLEPYLLATARAYPALAGRLEALVERTATTKRSVVHGDVSPKNILVGPKGPVFLDAECAWFGDPAFDLAFCLNHLLLKCIVAPQASVGFLTSFDALRDAYLARVDWEIREQLEGRVASLLPALLLARVDGKSPVEYLTSDQDRDIVRTAAIPLIEQPPPTLGHVRDAWALGLGAMKAGTT